MNNKYTRTNWKTEKQWTENAKTKQGRGAVTTVSLNNYRPISLLSIFNKLLEKLVFNRLSNYLEKRQLIFSKQFGFRSHHSTVHGVLSIIDKVQKAIEDREYSCGISWTSVKHWIYCKPWETSYKTWVLWHPWYC